MTMTDTQLTDKNVAVLHGNYFQRGGGEVVADAIARAFDAPLFYGFGNDEATQRDDAIERIQLFNPGKIAGSLAESVHQFRDACFMWSGQYLPELYEFDVIIQSGNEFGWFSPKDHQRIIKYVHSPPRGPYDMFHQHGSSPLHRAYSLATKVLYRHTTTYPDVYLANSGLVENRCEKYWGVDADVVYPPVNIDDYGPDNAETDRERTYLTFSRLFRHKRTREIVDAFADLPDARLIVGGDGPQREALEERATDNVEIRGYLAEDEKQRLLAECDALLFNARNEDFGIVPIEAFASGTPVLGVRDGFTQAQIADGKNGMKFPRGEPEDIVRCVRRFERDGIVADAAALQRFAERFSREQFEAGLLRAVEQADEQMAVDNIASDIDWTEPVDEDPERVRVATDGGER